MGEVTKMMIDPPVGWRFGFPRVYDPKPGQSEAEWFAEVGYPQELIDRGMLKYCRTWPLEDAEAAQEEAHREHGGEGGA